LSAGGNVRGVRKANRGSVTGEAAIVST
jgi:hypothetical protein